MRLPLDEVPVHVHRFAAGAPCDSKGSQCQCGIHRAETAAALRSRKTERAAKEKPTPTSHIFFSHLLRLGTPTRRHALGRLPTPPPLPKSATQTAQKTALCAPARTQEVSESENRPATRGTAHSEVQGDDRGTARGTARCSDRPMAALHFLLPTGDSRSGRRSFDSKLISLLPLDEVPVHVHPFAARAPCDSKGSQCQCGIHTAEAASALRSRKTERAAKEKPTPISQIFF